MEDTIAWIDDVHELTVHGDIDQIVHNNENPVICWAAKQTCFQTKVGKIINDTTIKIHCERELPMGEVLTLHCGDTKIPVFAGAVVRTKWFDNQYAAPDVQLGALCNSSATSFCLWAPTATKVSVLIADKTYVLNRKSNGVWKATIRGNWHNYAYTYHININGQSEIVNDPYAKASLANSEKGVIVDFAQIRSNAVSPVPRPKQTDLMDSIIYEIHVRDATIHQNSGVKNKGKFTGLAEKSTTTINGFQTGLSYLKNLGITHVQLLPINDFARVDELHPDTAYNWGYDPLFYQVPEGSYSNEPANPLTRINECITMIESFHAAGISVILDVVYNHVFIKETSAFEKIVPGYFFRYHPDGILSNGTGVGNDFASERIMTRKFIIDSIDHWLNIYRVDGFRFDLMGALDITTMNAIKKRCNKEEVPIMLLGEGWELSTALADSEKATNKNALALPGIRFFNDFFRDTLKGDLFDDCQRGYVNGDGNFIDRLPHILSGSIIKKYGQPIVSDISQTINYVECHDNHTLWDRLLRTNPDAQESDLKKMHQLATGLTLLSQGVPFIHAGQEWFRTKHGTENSYMSGDRINWLDWDKREMEKENIHFIRSLIFLRRKYHVFRLKTTAEIINRFHVLETPKPVFGFTLLGDSTDFSIYVNPGKRQHPLHLPSSGKWRIVATNAQDKVQQLIIGEFTTIDAFELIVLQKSRNGSNSTTTEIRKHT